MGEVEARLRGEEEPGLVFLDRLALSLSLPAAPCPSATLPDSPLSALTAVAMLICFFSSPPLREAAAEEEGEASFREEALGGLERGLLLRVLGDLRPTTSNCSNMFLLQELAVVEEEDTVLSPTAPSSPCEGGFLEEDAPPSFWFGEWPVLAGDDLSPPPFDNCFLTMLARFTSGLWEMSSICTTALRRRKVGEEELEGKSNAGSVELKVEGPERFKVMD